MKPDKVEEEIETRLRGWKDRGDFKGVHACASSGDVTDEGTVRLTVLDPKYGHKVGENNSPAILEAEEILNNHGNGPRYRKNMLVFSRS